MKNSTNIIIVIAVIIAVGALVYFTHNKKQNTTMPTDQTQNTNPEANATNSADRVAQAGDTVTVNYTGSLTNGTVFDSNVDPKFQHVSPFIFTLGAGQVIAGWDEGIVGMKVGEKKHLVIPPDKAYGPKDYGPIPGNSTLIFDVELLAIK